MPLSDISLCTGAMDSNSICEFRETCQRYLHFIGESQSSIQTSITFAKNECMDYIQTTKEH